MQLLAMALRAATLQHVLAAIDDGDLSAVLAAYLADELMSALASGLSVQPSLLGCLVVASATCACKLPSKQFDR